MEKLRVEQNKRLESLDILRGFDMFWLVGGGALIRSLAKSTEWDWIDLLETQTQHVYWAGFHFWDLIMPLFMFCSGVAIPYSIISKVNEGVPRTSLLKKIIRRGVVLILLGILYNGALKGEFVNLKYTSILGLIGMAYMIAAIICLYTRSFRIRVIWILSILALIAVLQLLVPLLGFGVTPISVPYSPDTVKGFIDRALIPGVFTYGTWCSLGILGAVSASSVVLIGSLAGSILRDGKPANTRKTLTLVYTGLGLVIIGVALSPFYPIIRRTWTVTLNLTTAGIGFLLLSLIYYFIDVLKWTSGIFAHIAFFFKVIGINAITIFLIHRFIDFSFTASYFVGWLEFYFGEWVIVLGAFILQWFVMLYLYKRKIFLRV